MEKSIKTLGLHETRIRLHPEVTVTVTVNVARSLDEAETQLHTGVAVTGMIDDEDEADGVEVAEVVVAEEASADEAPAENHPRKTPSRTKRPRKRHPRILTKPDNRLLTSTESRGSPRLFLSAIAESVTWRNFFSYPHSPQN